MKVRIQFFDMGKKSEEEFTFSDPITCEQAIEHLMKTRNDHSDRRLVEWIYSVNNIHRPSNHLLMDGDQLTVFTMLSLG